MVTRIGARLRQRSETLQHRESQRSRGRIPGRGGFTLIELLIVVAIVGIIGAILIPNLLDAMQKAKQRRVMTDMQLTGTAWMSWLTDLAGAAAAGRGATSQVIDWSSTFQEMTHSEVEGVLVPQYAREIPRNDPWHQPYDFRVTDDPVAAPVPFGLRSPAADGVYEGDAYPVGAFAGTDYSRDIVWAGGFFVRWPGRLGQGS